MVARGGWGSTGTDGGCGVSAADVERFLAAAHAMQSGVTVEHGRGADDGTPKHLRVGVNAAMVHQVALVDLLIKKGVLTSDEYERSLADHMEAEVARYETRLSQATGVRVRLA